jgi:hypothetical protein
MNKARPRDNRCYNCGRPYHRRNLTEQWKTHNPGHRAGWVKETVKIGTCCATAKASQRVLVVASTTVVASPEKKKATG